MSLASIAERAQLTRHSTEHVIAELVRTGMASADAYASDTRHDKLIMELQEEVNKLQKIVENPAKRISNSDKPKRIKKPGSLPENGYALSPFGRTCLGYLEDLDPEQGEDMVEGEDRMATAERGEHDDLEL